MLLSLLSDAVDNDHVISDDDVETAEEKRLRLAKEYIAEIEAKGKNHIYNYLKMLFIEYSKCIILLLCKVL